MSVTVEDVISQAIITAIARGDFAGNIKPIARAAAEAFAEAQAAYRDWKPTVQVSPAQQSSRSKGKPSK
ncbi:MAG: hypothetical protein JO269_09470 [Burkholderiaceae bacterium]|nr:hypothetical protein [Burkholderiaceae bacterium]